MELEAASPQQRISECCCRHSRLHMLVHESPLIDLDTSYFKSEDHSLVAVILDNQESFFVLKVSGNLV